MFDDPESHMKTTLSCPYCIGWFQGKGKKPTPPGTKPKGAKSHALMSNMEPICGAKIKKPEYTEDQLTAAETITRLKLSLGCGHCIRKLLRSTGKGIIHADTRIPLSRMWPHL
jgi:hypothetical protein